MEKRGKKRRELQDSDIYDICNDDEIDDIDDKSDMSPEDEAFMRGYNDALDEEEEEEDY